VLNRLLSPRTVCYTHAGRFSALPQAVEASDYAPGGRGLAMEATAATLQVFDVEQAHSQSRIA